METTKHKAPGKAFRKGITLFDLQRMFPDEAAARTWFEAIVWPAGERYCPHCGTDNNHECSHAKMPYRCRDCKRYFSVKTVTVMASSPIPLLKWLYAIYLDTTSLKGVSSMKLHRDLGVTQKTAWFMLQRIREFNDGPSVRFGGPVEADEAYFGGKRKNMHAKQRERLEGRGTAGKVAVVGVKDRETKQVAARVVRSADGETLQAFVREHVEPGSDVFTDDAGAYGGLSEYGRGTVKHSGRRVRGRQGPHERRRVVLVDAQAGAQGRVPQAVTEAPTALRQPVRRPPQHPRVRHPRTNGDGHRRAGRQAPNLRVADSAERPVFGRTGGCGMSKDSEFRAYIYIESALKNLGWDTRNPGKGGHVYTQGEFYNHDSLLTRAWGTQAPENTVLVQWEAGPRYYWTVESKREHKDLQIAVDEAQDYGNQVNALSPGLARFATGIAGTPDESFYVSTSYWDDNEWRVVAINDYDTTGFLSPDQCADMLHHNSAVLAEFDDDPERFLAKANAINKTLHENEVPVGERAHLIAALLLALAQDGNLRIHRQPKRLIREVNGLIEDILAQHGKEQFAPGIQLQPPATEKNHMAFRSAIVSTLQHLREMNIRSAINADDDALGKFYETFLKYANGAKEMGIVLTPRHITRFAVEAVGVTSSDTVFDPTAVPQTGRKDGSEPCLVV